MKNAALFREKLITKIYFLDSKDREASYLGSNGNNQTCE